ncbi:class I SAM-dependent methyltransferase [Rhodoferax ferrireducens]|uniref:class I SAM-dependent methyltransferase n=1 Tax=Rhodoferax ferrireducens TaxID=192843 RepID=UPI000E0CDE3C|nr:methyltransferase domain-containing protein [Rhodoferax ferrireducens]
MEIDPGHASTVIVDSYRNLNQPPLSESNSYKGLRIHALPGLHEFLAAVTLKHMKIGSSLLDIAAGSGAMSQRLSDMGYQVTATDYVTENFKLHSSIPFVTSNLNELFSNEYSLSFEAIIASEIIEHLENPRHFARECFKLLAPGGKLVLSTPNIDSPASIASFLRSGTFLWFSDTEYQVDGHITPLSQWQLHKCFSEAGFLFRWKGSFGKSEQRIQGSPRLMLLTKGVQRLSCRSNDLEGEIFVAVLEKPEAGTSASGCV